MNLLKNAFTKTSETKNETDESMEIISCASVPKSPNLASETPSFVISPDQPTLLPLNSLSKLIPISPERKKMDDWPEKEKFVSDRPPHKRGDTSAKSTTCDICNAKFTYRQNMLR